MIQTHSKLFACGAALLGSLAATASAQQVGFHVLPIPAGFNDSRVLNLSFDGASAVGIVGDNASSAWAYRFDLVSGLSLVANPSGSLGSAAYGITADGSTVAGSYVIAGQQANDRGFVTGPNGVSTDLGTLPHRLYFQTRARNISPDGSAVVGFVQGATDLDRSEAMIWTASGGIRTLGYVDFFDSYSNALAASNNGRVVVGETTSSGFVWTAETGMQIPMRVPGIIDEVGKIVDINPEGNIFLAHGRRGANRERVYVRYTDGVPELLFTSPRTFELGSISDDGRVVFGTLNGIGGQLIPSVWTTETGLISLVDYLALHGVAVPASVDRFYWSYAMSGDGRTFGGLCGLAGQQLFPGFVATIPAPGSVVVLGVLAVVRRRRTARALSNC